MTTALIRARDSSTADHSELRVTLNAREWGVVDLAGPGPVLLLLPGTLGRGDIFWQQMAALRGRVRLLAVTYPATGGVAEWAADMAGLMLAEVGSRIPAPELRNRLKAIRFAPPRPPVSLPQAQIVTIKSADDPLIPQAMRDALRDALHPSTSYRLKSGGHFPYVTPPRLYTAIPEEQPGLVPDGSSPWGRSGVRLS